MAIFKCKMCGGALEINNNETAATCEYCGTQQTLPSANDEVITNLHNRANSLRLKCEFDKAEDIYNKILEKNAEDAEAHWGIILCKYGIEYVEDPKTYKRVPTCHRTSFEAVLADEDYKAALEYADSVQCSLYEAEAKEIDRIQKDILSIVKNEKPFDVFICYKETDNNGRTQDSVIANDIYHQLTQEGFKVFYAAITLEDKVGQEYEPYIFAALNSAKVMLVVGSKPEYFNAVWVKNEWLRFMKLMKTDRSKLLIPCYKDMDAYELPEEFAHLQAQDMSKIGFINDIVRGIKKVISVESAQTPYAPKSASDTASGGSAAPLLKRGYMFLEDGNWQDADAYFERVLDIDPECAKAYLGKFMVDIKINTIDALLEVTSPDIFENQDYKKAIRFGDEKLKTELQEYIFASIYSSAVNAMNTNNYVEANNLFSSIVDYSNSNEMVEKCKEKIAEEEKTARDIAVVIKQKRKADAAKGQKDRLQQLKTEIAKLIEIENIFPSALEAVDALCRQEEECKKQTRNLESELESLGLFAGKRKKQIRNELDDLRKKCIDITKQRDRQYRKMAGYNTLGDVQKKNADYQQEIGSLEEILNKSQSNQRFSYAQALDLLQKNAHIRNCVRKELVNFAMIQTVSAGAMYTVGLKSDGTVVAVGNNDYGRCEVGDWTDIIAVSAGTTHTVGLKSDGTVVAMKYTGDYFFCGGQCDVDDWTDIIAVSGGGRHTVGLKSDGTVVATEYTGDAKYYHGQCDVDDWTDIIAISTGLYHTVGLKSDGTVVATKYTGIFYFGECDVDDWTDIIAVSAGGTHTVGLKSDGTVVAVGYNDEGQCDVDGWTDIKLPE